MSSQSIYKSSKGKVRVLEMYDRFQADVDVQLEDHTVDTRFGTTHVLATGPENAQPVVITHGGNQTNPHALRNLSPLLKLNQYRVYAPDTVGHPGKSAQTRLSPRDSGYGQWLYDVLDGLNLESAAFVGGSFGAGIILRLAAYAPQRISKLALFVPSGIVRVPLSSMVFRIGGPYLRYLLSPSRERLIRAAQWMGDDLGENDLEWIEVAFRHVRIEPEMPRPATKEELEGLKAPTLVIAAEQDAMFPGDAVVKRAKEIIPNLVAAECLEGGTHFSSEKDIEYINGRIHEFLQVGR
jgi:pimeloyl-ACP methyl ester carboxylesterase